MTRDPVILGVALTATILIISKLPIKMIWNASKPFLIILPIAYILLFTFLLENIKQGTYQGLFFATQFIILIFAGILFAMTTSPRDLMLSLTKMKIPYEFAFMLTLALRFVPVITREINHVMDAQKARAYKIKLSPIHPIQSSKTFIPILIPTFHILLIKSFDLSLSVEARAFRAYKTRTTSPRLRLKLADYIAITILIIISLW
jgi:energy-coupling factor transport system permease protein